MYLGKNSHILCWIFSKGLYGKLGWGFVGNNDICFNIRIVDDIIRASEIRKKRRGILNK
jgi:hypothetical protein